MLRASLCANEIGIIIYLIGLHSCLPFVSVETTLELVKNRKLEPVVCLLIISRMSHKLEFGDSHGKVLDANVTDVDRYEIYDPRNPMTKRRNEEAKKEAKKRRKEKQSVV